MKKESLAYSVFRVFAILTALFMVAMIWWSLVDQEADLGKIKETLQKIETKVKAPATLVEKSGERTKVNQPLFKQDPSNLLSEDNYFTHVLPEQLGKDFLPHGVFRGYATGKPDNLSPFSNWAGVRKWQSYCGTSVARSKFGVFDTYTPNMAYKMEEKTNVDNLPEYWIYLRDNVYWQPLEPSWFPADFQLDKFFMEKHKVTAHDYKFFFDAFMNSSVADSGAIALRTLYSDIKEIEVIDNFTFVVRWKSPLYVAKLYTSGFTPLPGFVYKYFPDGKKIVPDDKDPDTYRKNPIWALNFSKHWANNIIVGCGAWFFDGMTERQIRFKRNPDHFFPLDALTSAKEDEIRFTLDSIWQEFKEGKIDTYELKPEQILDFNNFLKSSLYVSQNAPIEKIEFPDSSYTYIGWNEKRDYFKSAKVRRALTMAIDRNRIIRQTLNGYGNKVHGTFLSSSPSSDPTIEPLPFDPIKARQLLEEEGWFDSKGEGVIGKIIEGQFVPFKFSLTYYVKNNTAKAVVEYIATALEVVGIKVDLNGVDVADLTKVFEDKNFDALYLGWQLGAPPENLRQLWSSHEAEVKGSSNAIGFKNKEVDEIIEKLDYEKDPQKRTVLYRQFDQIIHQEQPYTFLYNPITILLYRKWVENVFIPADRQDVIPGANVLEPQLEVTWLGER